MKNTCTFIFCFISNKELWKWVVYRKTWICIFTLNWKHSFHLCVAFVFLSYQYFVYVGLQEILKHCLQLKRWWLSFSNFLLVMQASKDAMIWRCTYNLNTLLIWAWLFLRKSRGLTFLMRVKCILGNIIHSSEKSIWISAILKENLIIRKWHLWNLSLCLELPL